MAQRVHLPRWEELPAIDLYIDQVVTLLETWLFFIPNNEEKLITKSMINNYVKHGIVDPPLKKKYTTKHLAYLIIVCIFKQVYSMNEITQMIRLQIHAYPLDEAYNYYIEDFEECVNNVLSGKPMTHKNPSKESELTALLHSVNESLVSKFNTLRYLDKMK